MKNRLISACAIMIGAATLFVVNSLANGESSAFNVYQYKATLNTAVAQTAKRVPFIIDGERYVENDVCYRTKGRVIFQGVIIAADDYSEEYMPSLMLLTSSEDKDKTLYLYLNFDDEGGMPYFYTSRIGHALSSKAKVAEVGFGVNLWTSSDPFANGCDRFWELDHGGFGFAFISKKDENGISMAELSRVSGTVFGWATPPGCTTVCQDCEDEDEVVCEYAYEFAPGEIADDDPFGPGMESDGGVAFGTFSLKSNKTYANAIKDVEGLEELIQVLIDQKAFKQIKSLDQVMPAGPGGGGPS